MNKKRILSALIGLMGAVGNNGKKENTDSCVITALLSDDNEKVIELIHKEKFAVSPDCASCMNPCGNTSDYDMSKWDEQPAEILRAKLDILELLEKIAINARVNNQELSENVYRAIAYMGYDLNLKSYLDIKEELQAYI